MARKKSPEANLAILQEKFVKIVIFFAQTHSCIVGKGWEPGSFLLFLRKTKFGYFPMEIQGSPT